MSGGIEQRVWMHYRSLKHASPRKWVETSRCGLMNACPEAPFFPHRHGYWKIATSNDVWLKLARVHKMPVRAIKDIVNNKRKAL